MKSSRILGKYKTTFLSLILALLMTITGVFVGNCPYPFWDNISWLCVAENLIRCIFGETNDIDDAYFVNVGFDKQLVDVQVTKTDKGHAVITDRKALLDFLIIAEQADYKYIFLDIRFEKGYSTEWDEALFTKIAGMRDIVCANHYDNFEIADSLLLSKAAYNDYNTTIFSSNFTRYQYLQDGRSSVALRMYQDIDGKTIKRKGLLYFNDGSLCENCPYIPIKGGVKHLIGDGNAAYYYNLGPFLLTLPEKQQIIESMKGKIVIVGDFIEDVHDTYMGMQPGPYLTYTAYKYLTKGGNRVSITVLFFMTLVFFLIFRAKLSGRSVFPCWEHFLRLRCMGWLHCLLNWRLTRIVSTFISYSLILSLICTIIYLICGHTFNVMLPAIVIAVISSIKDSQKTETT